jgi:hypothetical protein
MIITNFQEKKYDETAKSIAAFLRSGNSILFNCFYTITNPVEAAQYNRKFTPVVILWNILFNLGFIYTNVKNSILFFFPGTTTNTNDWGWHAVLSVPVPEEDKPKYKNAEFRTDMSTSKFFDKKQFKEAIEYIGMYNQKDE